MSSRVETEVTVLRRGRWIADELSKLCLAIAVLTGLGALVWLGRHPSARAAAFAIVPLGLAVASFVARRAARPRRDVLLVADGDGLRLGSRRVPHAALTVASSTYGTAGAVRVTIERLGRLPIDIELGDRLTASAVVDALRLGPAERSLSRRIASPAARLGMAAFVLGLLPGGCIVGAQVGTHPSLVLVWLAMLVVSAAVGLVPARIVVGTDAITERWLWRQHVTLLRDVRRFDPIGSFEIEIARIALPKRIVRVRGGREAFVERARLLERARAVLEASPSPAPAQFHAWASARAALAPAAWVAAMRAADGTYRDAAPFERAELLAVLDDTRAEPLDRAAAAIALAARRHEVDRSLRIAEHARATAIPALRSLLEAAARDEEPAIVRAVARLRATLSA